jgi:hypothetical protein
MNDTPKEIALEAVNRLDKITLARTHLELWRERYNLAGLQINRWTQELKAAEHLSETGETIPQQRITW